MLGSVGDLTSIQEGADPGAAALENISDVAASQVDARSFPVWVDSATAYSKLTAVNYKRLSQKCERSNCFLKN